MVYNYEVCIYFGLKYYEKDVYYIFNSGQIKEVMLLELQKIINFILEIFKIMIVFGNYLCLFIK